MADAGLTPHLLIWHAPAPAALAQAHERGWSVELADPATRRRDRVRQHLTQVPRLPVADVRARIAAPEPGVALIQFEDFWAAQYALSPRGPAGPPRVLSLYNVESTGRRRREARRIRSRAELLDAYAHRRLTSVERRAVRRSDLIVCVSDADERFFTRAGARATLLTPNGVDDDLFAVAPAPAGSDDLLFFGALSYAPNADGIERFLRSSWPLVRERHSAARLRVVGADAPPSLEHAAEAAPGVELVGFVEDLREELARARLVIAPIRFGGGTRIKVLEAMASGRSVVATSVGVEGIGFTDGVHGLVRDDDASFAGAVVELLRDPARAAAIGERARERAEGYRWQQATAALTRYYADVAERAGS